MHKIYKKRGVKKNEKECFNGIKSYGWIITV